MSGLPRIGELTLLVYRECPCGRWCATGEGAQAPRCDACGGWFVPGGGPWQGPPMFGDSHAEARQRRCLGFVAFLTSEQGAVSLIARVSRFLGFADLWDHMSDPGRHYLERETQAASDEISAAVEEYRDKHMPDCDGEPCVCGFAHRQP